MASFASSAASLALIFCLMGAALPTTTVATTYTVGDSGGWTMGVDFAAWASDKSFTVGDSLQFNYPIGSTTVDEVSSGDYATCMAADPIFSDGSGATTIPLKTAGTHYFICGTPGYCEAGMKLAVDVVAAYGSAGAAATSTLPAGPLLTSSW